MHEELPNNQPGEAEATAQLTAYEAVRDALRNRKETRRLHWRWNVLLLTISSAFYSLLFFTDIKYLYYVAFFGCCCVMFHNNLIFPYMSRRLGTFKAASDDLLAKQLTALNTPRDVGLLAVIAVRVSSHRRVAIERLRKLSPRVQASDAPFITPEGMDALLELLYSQNLPLMSALLTALEQVGDARAVPVLERLAEATDTPSHPKKFLQCPREFGGNYMNDRGAWRRVRNQAVECLAAVKAHLDEEKPRTTLLRPADSPTGTLLRPAAGTASTTGDHLLRPVRSETENHHEQSVSL
jgi:hypothetical protein